MNASRLWAFGSVVVILALVAGTWFIGISPQLAAAAAANNSRSAVEVQNAGHRATLLSLEKQFSEIDTLRDELEELRKAVPVDAGVPELLTQLHQLAATSGVTVTSLTVGDPATYAPIENTTDDPELAAALTSVSNGAFLIVPIDIRLSGPYQNVMGFIASLQSGERLILVHDVTLSSGLMVADSQVELGVSGQTFVLLDVAAAPMANAPATDAAAPLPDGSEPPQ